MKTESNCQACNTKYLSSELGIVPDSHFDYTEYFPCPKCGYNPEIPTVIYKTLEERMRVEFRPDGKARMNTRELADLIVTEIIKLWPRGEKC